MVAISPIEPGSAEAMLGFQRYLQTRAPIRQLRETIITSKYFDASSSTVLTEDELELFYHQLSRFHNGLKEWKMHYAAWVLAYFTKARLGLFTVSPGNEKGARIGNSNIVRPEDLTLRWQDVSFLHVDGIEGVCVQIDFWYLTNAINPLTGKLIPGERRLTIAPTKGNRYHLDLSAILLALAFARGLFHFRTIDELMADPALYVDKVDAVNKQAVFVQADQNGVLLPEIARQQHFLNPKLQQMCKAAGLLQRNTFYDFRRTANIGVRGSECSETMVQSPHAGIATVASFDKMTQADLVIAAKGTGADAVFDRNTLRRACNRAQLDLAHIDDSDITTVGL